MVSPQNVNQRLYPKAEKDPSIRKLEPLDFFPNNGALLYMCPEAEDSGGGMDFLVSLSVTTHSLPKKSVEVGTIQYALYK